MLYKHWKYTTRKEMKGVLLFLSKITCKQSLDPEDELVLNTFELSCNFSTQS